MHHYFAKGPELLGASPGAKQIQAYLDKVAQVDTRTILIVGESGTGKDLLARIIHARGKRKDKRFLEVDCATLPESLIESELFGHEKGSFTGAHQTKRGLFELAQDGTLFLDEIGDMSLNAQAKLLRAIENRHFKRVGGLDDLTFNASLIAATNKDLRALVADGRFREDLYFRLNVINIRVPPLRERKDDIQMLAKHFIAQLNHQLGLQVDSLSPATLAALDAYSWPGNVRELRNLLECTMTLNPDEHIIQEHHLPDEWRLSDAPVLGNRLLEVEQRLIEQAVQDADGNQSAAARSLGIGRFALRYRLKRNRISQEQSCLRPLKPSI